MVYKSDQIFLPFCHNARVWRTEEFSSLDRVCIACSAVKTFATCMVRLHLVVVNYISRCCLYTRCPLALLV